MRSNINYIKNNQYRVVKPLLVSALEQIEPSKILVAIDFGCGIGIESEHLIKHTPRQVIAIDKDPYVLALCEQRLEKTGCDRFEIWKKSFDQILELPACELIYSYHSLHFASESEYQRLWNLILNALRPGGVLAVSVFGLKDTMVLNKHAVGISEQEIKKKLAGYTISHFKEILSIDDKKTQKQDVNHYMEIIATKHDLGLN